MNFQIIIHVNTAHFIPTHACMQNETDRNKTLGRYLLQWVLFIFAAPIYLLNTFQTSS